MRSAASSPRGCARCSARSWWWRIAPARAGRSARPRSRMHRLTATRSASAPHRRWRSIPQPTRTFRSMCSNDLVPIGNIAEVPNIMSVNPSVDAPTWPPSSRLPARIPANCPMRRRATVRSAICSASSSSWRPAPTSSMSPIKRRRPGAHRSRRRSGPGHVRQFADLAAPRARRAASPARRLGRDACSDPARRADLCRGRSRRHELDGVLRAGRARRHAGGHRKETERGAF